MTESWILLWTAIATLALHGRNKKTEVVLEELHIYSRGVWEVLLVSIDGVHTQTYGRYCSHTTGGMEASIVTTGCDDRQEGLHVARVPIDVFHECRGWLDAVRMSEIFTWASDGQH